MSAKLLSTAAAALCLYAVGSASASEVDWSLYEASCAGGAAEVVIPCGDYGRFLVLPTAAPAACEPVASGVDHDPPAYPHTPIGHAFPMPPRKLHDITTVIVVPHGLGLVAGDPIDRWIGVIDFDNAHGASTTGLAGEVAGPEVTTVLAPLDDPALAPVGPVGDFHVLARLCEIVEAVDAGALPPPATVNMSFGRATRAADPVDASSCPFENAACQVAKVAHYLKGKGTYLVAAAGNHGAGLFPGTLADVISAGMLDLTPFVHGGPTRAAWETPPDAEGWIPGNALCLDGWSAPAGSSYSSALLSGWLVEVLEHPARLALLGDGPWQPAWNAHFGCFVLSRGRKLTPWCNAAVTALFADLAGTAPGGCDTASSGTTASAPELGRATTPGTLPSLDAWGEATHPAPESDPCVPCTGEVVFAGSSTDLIVDMGRSGPLPAGIVFDEVSLRIGNLYHPIALTTEELDLMRLGALATIVIPGVGGLFPPDVSLSLWYRMREDVVPSCATLSNCFWSSTPLYLETLLK